MRTIVIRHYGGPEVLEPAEAADPQPGEGETLVRVAVAAVNPADVKWRAGMFAGFAPVSFPHVLGYDIAGEVVAGAGWPAGTRVFGMLDPIAKGGYAEFAVTSPARLAAVPDGLDLAVAAAIPTAGLTGRQMIDTALDVVAGQRILVTGAVGAVGRFAVHAARARGAVVIAGVRGSQQAEALALGADETAVLDGKDRVGPPFDHVVDTVGGAAVARLCRHLVEGGRIVTAATTPIPADGLSAAPEFFAVQPDGAALARLAAAVAAGRIAVPIARQMPLADAAAAHMLVERGGTRGKIVLTV